VKDTNDLLALRSDCYMLTVDFQVVPNPERTLPPIVIDLDPGHYKLIDDFEARFPRDVPSLVACESLTIRGKFTFGPEVALRGRVKLMNDGERDVNIEAHALIEGARVF
jgi:UTP--glucose-1-phosphate uridylyltransferase